MKKYIFIVFSYFLITSLQAQERHEYEITIAGFSIGEMTATKTEEGDTTTYLLTSKVSLWLFGQINIDYVTDVKYVGNRFIRSTVASQTNRGNFLSRIWLEDEFYQVDAKSYKYEIETVIRENIDYSAVRLFFEEPIGRRRMIAENYGVFGSIKALGSSEYETLANENKNKYTYINGKLDRAVMHSPIKNYIIKRK
ncbi:DUF6134 family protein [Lunatibacter salilacus]|uniref:DUF6134 family protein n=1 Tax=Lunatibacter salilacus TaxID=2483804 RepID=UPI001F2C61A8|nr:DUF6134 family protein [Lunatibacter salilacus]